MPPEILPLSAHVRASVGALRKTLLMSAANGRPRPRVTCRCNCSRKSATPAGVNLTENQALPCARRGWLPLPRQDGALPDDFGALLPDDLGGSLLPDLGAGHTGDLGWAPLLARLNRPTSPEAVRPEVLRATPGRKPEMTSAHCSALGRRSGSLMHLATRSATSCGASSGTLRAPLGVL